MSNTAIRAGLIGHGIKGSLTPSMHEAEGRAQGLHYVYDRFDTNDPLFSDTSLEDLISKAEAAGYAGLNVTHPFKREVIGLLHQVSNIARMIGAVNTVALRQGTSSGYNTDYTAFRSAFRQRIPSDGRDSVLLLGAGGAGSAVAFGLIDEGVARLVLYDRVVERAEELQDRLSRARPEAEVVLVPDIMMVQQAQVNGVVNATPMGMVECPGSAIDIDHLSAGVWVADIVYFPLQTDLLRQARQRGCLVMDGSGMAIGQAVEAFQLITGYPANADRVAANFAVLISGTQQPEARLQ